MSKKYELMLNKSIEFLGKKLFRIKALVDIERWDVKAGDEGGYIEAEKNLSHDCDAWVYGDARVYGNAEVYGDAEVSGNARVSGDARVSGAYKIMTISNMGSVQRTTTFFACKDGKIRVCCGCFFGDLDQFRAKVKGTHKDTKHAQAYLAAADFAESVLISEVQDE